MERKRFDTKKSVSIFFIQAKRKVKFSVTFLDAKHYKAKLYVFWLNRSWYLSLFNIYTIRTYFGYLYYLPIYHLHIYIENVIS